MSIVNFSRSGEVGRLQNLAWQTASFLARFTGGGQWAVLEENGQSALSFTSFLDVQFRGEGKALSYPLEEGAFANHNKTKNPRSLSVSLGVQGGGEEFGKILDQLEEYRSKAARLTVVTPAMVYSSFTLESFSYEQRSDNGANMLIASLNLVEVCEANEQPRVGSLGLPKNPSSVSAIYTGRSKSLPLPGPVESLLRGNPYK